AAAPPDGRRAVRAAHERTPKGQAAQLRPARGARAEGASPGRRGGGRRARAAVLREPRPGDAARLRVVVGPDAGGGAARRRGCARHSGPGRGGRGRALVRRAPGDAALLLPNFDEYTVGYADRAALMHPERPFRPELFAFSSVLSNVLVIGGTLAGAWRRVAARDGVRIEVRPLAKLDAAEQRLVERAAERYSRFLGLPARVVWL